MHHTGLGDTPLTHDDASNGANPPAPIDVDDVPSTRHRGQLQAVPEVIDETPISPTPHDELPGFVARGKKLLDPHRRNQRGASLVEYALLVGLIAVVCIAVVTLLKGGYSEVERKAKAELEARAKTEETLLQDLQAEAVHLNVDGTSYSAEFKDGRFCIGNITGSGEDAKPIGDQKCT